MATTIPPALFIAMPVMSASTALSSSSLNSAPSMVFSSSQSSLSDDTPPFTPLSVSLREQHPVKYCPSDMALPELLKMSDLAESQLTPKQSPWFSFATPKQLFSPRQRATSADLAERPRSVSLLAKIQLLTSAGVRNPRSVIVDVSVELPSEAHDEGTPFLGSEDEAAGYEAELEEFHVVVDKVNRRRRRPATRKRPEHVPSPDVSPIVLPSVHFRRTSKPKPTVTRPTLLLVDSDFERWSHNVPSPAPKKRPGGLGLGLPSGCASSPRMVRSSCTYRSPSSTLTPRVSQHKFSLAPSPRLPSLAQALRALGFADVDVAQLAMPAVAVSCDAPSLKPLASRLEPARPSLLQRMRTAAAAGSVPPSKPRLVPATVPHEREVCVVSPLLLGPLDT